MGCQNNSGNGITVISCTRGRKPAPWLLVDHKGEEWRDEDQVAFWIKKGIGRTLVQIPLIFIKHDDDEPRIGVSGVVVKREWAEANGLSGKAVS